MINLQTISFTNYTIGEDAFDLIPSICTLYGAKFQIIGGKKAIEVVMPELEDSIKDTNLLLLEPLFYGGECSHENIDKLAKIIEENGASIIAGVGGGKAIDTAKAVANLLKLPIITIPTIAATCAATTALSVVYSSNHKFVEFIHFEKPPLHAFINSKIIANAPYKYLRAGMGDTMAKHYECTLSARGDELNFTNELATTISNMCIKPLYKYGLNALEDCKKAQVTPCLEEVIQANIVNTGMVSLLIDEEYNGAIAHSLFYGLTLFPHIEEKYLHGDVVGYGVLVQLMIDNNKEEVHKVRKHLQEWGCPIRLKDIEVCLERSILEPILEETVNGPDMEHLPYKVNEDMVYEALVNVENL